MELHLSLLVVKVCIHVEKWCSLQKTEEFESRMQMWFVCMLPANISTFLRDAETIDAEYIKMGERIEQGIVGN